MSRIFLFYVVSFLFMKVCIFWWTLNLFTKGKYLCFQTAWTEISKMSLEIMRWRVWKNEEKLFHIKSIGYSQVWIVFRGSSLSFSCKYMTCQILFINITVFIKRWEYQTTCLPPEKPVCRTRSNSKNLTWNNRLVSNWEIYKAVYYHPACLVYL